MKYQFDKTTDLVNCINTERIIIKFMWSSNENINVID